jgi:hypothetical protein
MAGDDEQQVPQTYGRSAEHSKFKSILLFHTQYLGGAHSQSTAKLAEAVSAVS